MEWKISVVILQNGQSGPLNAVRDEKEMERDDSETVDDLNYG